MAIAKRIAKQRMPRIPPDRDERRLGELALHANELI